MELELALGLALAVATAVATNAAFLMKHRGALAAPDVIPAAGVDGGRALPLQVVGDRVRRRDRWVAASTYRLAGMIAFQGA